MTQERSDRSRWLAILWLLPTGVLALPWFLAGDPLPHASATGWALLFALPALAASCFNTRSGLPMTATCFVPLLAIGGLAYFGDDATDRFELVRTIVLLLLCLTAYLSGTRFSDKAQELFRRGLVLLSLAFSSEALFGFLGSETGGSLGNSGVLSAVALPGAVLGALSVTSGPIIFRIIGALAALLFSVYVGTTPVLTGVLAFTGALAIFAIATRSKERRLPVSALAFATIAPILLAVSPLFASQSSPSASTGSNIGGAEVRLLIWQQVPELVADHALLGVGPGQFRARFPQYRDSAEIELSTFNHASEAGTEVEHAHSDVIQTFAEFGLIGGFFFALLLTLTGISALSHLFRQHSSFTRSEAMGAAALALLFNSTLHAPLTFEPAPALIAWVLFGALNRSDADTGRGLYFGRLVPIGAVLTLLAFIPNAMAMTKHGELLGKRQQAAAHHQKQLASSADPQKAGSEFWLEEGRILRKLIEAAPDSALAQTLLAKHFSAWDPTPTTAARAVQAWTRVLELRPHQVSALIGLGVLTDDTDQRRELWEHATAVDPGHPIALANLARLEFLEGEAARGFDHLRALEELGRVDNTLIRDLGSRALLAGRTTAGCQLLARLELEFDFNRPDDMYALAQQEEQLATNTLFADALTCGAHRLWALENLANDDLAFARSKFRQALKVSRRYLPDGDTPTRLLLAATLELTDRGDDARYEIEQLGITSIPVTLWNEFPERVHSALRRLGLQLPTAATPQ